jgi:hypothetical protein
LIQALLILSRDIESEDGVANAAIQEAACRLISLSEVETENIALINERNTYRAAIKLCLAYSHVANEVDAMLEPLRSVLRAHNHDTGEESDEVS